MFNGEIIFHLKRIEILVDMCKKHMWTSGFYRYEHIYSYKRQEFQNILEINLCNCFGQLLLIYLKNVEYGIEHDVLDSPYGVCIH